MKKKKSGHALINTKIDVDKLFELYSKELNFQDSQDIQRTKNFEPNESTNLEQNCLSIQTEIE
jgi:hypothetical protein